MYELELTAHDRQQRDFYYDSAIYILSYFLLLPFLSTRYKK